MKMVETLKGAGMMRALVSLCVVLVVGCKSGFGYGDRYAYAGLPGTTPAYTNTLSVVTNVGYIVAYDEQRKSPAWTCYRLFKVDSLIAPPRPKEFITDARIRERVTSSDYDGSGYDRGHQAPNYAIGVCYGTNAQLQTFLMSNVVPQKPNMNREIWERLEVSEIKDWAQRFTNIWVVTGPVYSDRSEKLKNGTLVPEMCFKIIVREEAGKPKVMAFEIPQIVTGNESPARFMTTVKEIEDSTGLTFFNALPAEIRTNLVNERVWKMW